MNGARRRIGEILRDAGQLDAGQVEQVLAHQRESGERFASCCLELGYLPENVLVEQLGKQKGYPGVDLSRSVLDLASLELVPEEVARQHLMLPLRLEGRHLLLGLADPEDAATIGEVEFVSGKRVIPHVVLWQRLRAAIQSCYSERAVDAEERHWFGPLAERTETPPAGGLLVVLGEVSDSEGFADLLGESDVVSAWLGGGDATVDTGDEPAAPELGPTPEPASPGAQAAPRSSGRSSAAGDEGAAEPASRTLLVVDDDPDILNMVCRYMEGHGFTTVRATAGREALKKIKESRPDLILLDAMLPEIHGFEICQKIKKSKRFGETPVIMISAVYKGWRYREDVQRTYGADDYFEKPFSLERLVKRVEELLARSRHVEDEAALLERSEQALQEGLEAQREGNIEAAIARFREGLEVDPLSVPLHFHLANLLATRSDLFEAIHALEKTIELDAGYFPALKGLAILYQKKGFVRKSVEMWERALYVAPDQDTRQKIRSHLFHML